MKIGKDSTFQDLIDLIKTKIPDPSNANPSMNGTASPGSSVKYAREDHTHPSDTSKFDISGGTITGSATIQGNLEAKEVKATDYAEVLEIDYTPNASNIVQVNVSVQSNTYNAGYRLDTGSGSGESGTLSNTYSAFRVVVTQNNEVLYNEVHRTENKLYSYDIPKGSVNVKVYCMIGSVIDGQGNLLASKAEYTDPRFLNANNLHNEDPTSDSTVYLRRQTTGGMCAIKKIVGGSVVKNQLAYNGNFADGTTGWYYNRVTLSASNNILTATCDTAGWATVLTKTPAYSFNDVKNHKVLVRYKIKPSVASTIKFNLNQTSINVDSTQTVEVNDTTNFTQISTVMYPTEDDSTTFRVGTTLAVGDTIQLKDVNLIDLTQMFGSTIADYIYSLEQTTAGSGIAKLAEWGFDFSVYHAYDAGSLQSVKLAAKRAIGFNQWDEQWELGYYTTTGEKDNGTTMIRSANYIEVFPNTTYYFKKNIGARICYYDGNYNFISYEDKASSSSVSITTPDGCKYIRFGLGAAYGKVYKNNICINLSKASGSPKNGDYEPYYENLTPLSPTDLRGIYSLDASNNLVSDGDEYYPDGGESVGYDICDLGAQNWTQSSVVSGLFLTSNVTNYKISNDIKGICNKYNFSGLVNTVNNAAAKGDGTITVFYNSSSTYVNTRYIFVYDTSKSSMTDNEFKAAMNGVYLVYQKNAKTTAQLSPYQSLESIANNGTEEYIDYGVQQGTRDLAIPPYSSAEYTEGNAENVIASGDVIDGYNNVLREKENHRDLISLLGDDESGRTTASRAYSVNEFFYKDGQIFKVTANIASGATFTVGTNCTQTTIFAVLTALLNA